ncbi:MAG: nuclear transport factor 2 family protein [Actinobacteria bacterium]|nr:nuclear transport factor 2 family protein [Actinomycetota bacterium]
MTANEGLIHRFYSAFQKQDAETMAGCYRPEVHFSDPVFTDLLGEEAGDMWRMLCSRATDLRIEFRDVTADEDRGSAHWEAWYTFSTGRKVHNVIDASFEFSDGLILAPRRRRASRPTDRGRSSRWGRKPWWAAFMGLPSGAVTVSGVARA